MLSFDSPATNIGVHRFMLSQQHCQSCDNILHLLGSPFYGTYNTTYHYQFYKILTNINKCTCFTNFGGHCLEPTIDNNQFTSPVISSMETSGPTSPWVPRMILLVISRLPSSLCLKEKNIYILYR